MARELTDLPVFTAMRKKLTWLTERHEVLARNIANADTPKFRAEDLKAFDFKKLVRQTRPPQIEVRLTDPGHMAGRPRAVKEFQKTEVLRPYETAPNGNSVILEEQMVKMNETSVSHNLITLLYKKHLNMIKTVAGRGGR